MRTKYTHVLPKQNSSGIAEFIGGGYKDMLGRESAWDKFIKQDKPMTAEEYEEQTGLKYDMVESEISGDYPDSFTSEEEEETHEV